MTLARVLLLLIELLQWGRGLNMDELPVLDLALAPPVHALPEVRAKVSALERQRELHEEHLLYSLEDALNDTIRAAGKKISEIIPEMIRGFRSLKAVPMPQPRADPLLLDVSDVVADPAFAVRLNLAPVDPPDALVADRLDAIEKRRRLQEDRFVKQASADIHGLTSVIINELQAQILSGLKNIRAHHRDTAKHTLFLKREGLPSVANIRVSAAGSWPRVADLVEGMELVRDRSEQDLRKHVLVAMAQIFQAANDNILQSLDSACNDFIHASNGV